MARRLAPADERKADSSAFETGSGGRFIHSEYQMTGEQGIGRAIGGPQTSGYPSAAYPTTIAAAGALG
jgi:hypothetical protein